MRRLVPLGVVVVLALAAVAVRSAAPPLPTLPPTGGLTFEVRDADGGAPIPCKLTLLGVEGTPTPQLTHNDIGRQEGDAVVRLQPRDVADRRRRGAAAARHLRRVREPRARSGTCSSRAACA